MLEYANHLESHVGESIDQAQNGGGQADDPGMPRQWSSSPKEFVNKSGGGETILQNSSEGISRVAARLEGALQHLESGQVDSEASNGTCHYGRLLVEALAARFAEQILEWEKEAKKELKIYRKDCRRKRTRRSTQLYPRQGPPPLQDRRTEHFPPERSRDKYLQAAAINGRKAFRF